MYIDRFCEKFVKDFCIYVHEEFAFSGAWDLSTDKIPGLSLCLTVQLTHFWTIGYITLISILNHRFWVTGDFFFLFNLSPTFLCLQRFPDSLLSYPQPLESLCSWSYSYKDTENHEGSSLSSYTLTSVFVRQLKSTKWGPNCRKGISLSFAALPSAFGSLPCTH